MRENGFRVLAISSGGSEVRSFIEEQKVAHKVISFSRSITPIKDIICLRQLIRLFRKIKPDIVHTHTPKAGLLGMWAAKIAGVPHRFHTVAGLPLTEYSGFIRWILEKAEVWTYRNSVKVFPNSIGLERYILERGWAKPEKVMVIGDGSSNGIDSNYFSRKALCSELNLPPTGGDSIQRSIRTLFSQLDLKDNHFVYVFIGRLVRDKGIRELVHAFEQLHKANENARLLLVGDYEDHREPLTSSLKQRVLKHPAIKHAGFQKDVRPFLAMADVFVFPSYREGFPNSVLQACCLELPGIVTDVYGCVDIIKHGVNGLIIPVKDQNSLYEAMFRLQEDPMLTSKLANSARNTIVEKYDQGNVWELLLREYHTALGQKYPEFLFPNVQATPMTS